MAVISLGTFGTVLTRILTSAPAYFLRKKYNKIWLADRIEVDLRPRNEPVRINGGELPDAHVWLTITNHGYFPVELDRLNLEFIYASLNVRVPYMKKIGIQPHSKVELFVRVPLTTEQVNYISKNVERPYIALQVSSEFNSEIHNFSVDSGQLTGINPSYMNLLNAN